MILISPSYSPPFFFFFPHICFLLHFHTLLALHWTATPYYIWIYYTLFVLFMWNTCSFFALLLLQRALPTSRSAFFWPGIDRTSRTSLCLSFYRSVPIPLHVASCVPFSQGLCYHTRAVISLCYSTMLKLHPALHRTTVSATCTETMAVPHNDKQN